MDPVHDAACKRDPAAGPGGNKRVREAAGSDLGKI